MYAATFNGLLIPFRKRHTSTFTTTAGSVVDAGPGRSFVGFWAPAALAAATMTFKGLPPTNDGAADEGVVIGDLKLTALTSVTVTETQFYYPLPPTEANGLRYLAPVSSESQDGKVVHFISKPV